MTASTRNNCFGIALAIAASAAAPAHAEGALENPAPAATASGIGVISGWHCTATRVDIEIDGGTKMPAAFGTDRLDTAATCGRRDTGFGLLLNWALLGTGPHTIRALADGVEFARRTFNVVSLGSEFITGKSGTVTLDDFPDIGKSVVLEWQQPLQSFAVRELRSDAPLLDGRWNGVNLERRTNCTSPQNEGTRGTYAQFDIGTDQGIFTISETAVTGLTCIYNGTYRQDGTQRHASGSYSCSDGKKGDFSTTSFLVTANEMSIRMGIKLTGGESCSIDAIVGGSRF